jgi:plasmid stabilization system protein ParE
MYSLVISTEAQEDLEKALIYYKINSESAAEKFIDTLQILYTKLMQTPQYFSYLDINKNLRKGSLTDFPYTIIFEIQDSLVFIFAIHNTHQNPDIISKRI